ncbi:MAG: hypothetical protein FWF95_06165 [Syntrophorhabdaceae bacterium]|nr:hypothetical protein [Syntrophorhabdaceae bacterium]
MTLVDNIVDLLHGKKPLWFTFWIGFVVSDFIFAATMALLDTDNNNAVLALCIKVVFAVYFIAIFRAIWKSSNAYQGLYVWKFLAKLQVVLGFVGLPIFMF